MLSSFDYFPNGFEMRKDGRWIFLIPIVDTKETAIITVNEL